jgi:hypothetical protein
MFNSRNRNPWLALIAAAALAAAGCSNTATKDATKTAQKAPAKPAAPKAAAAAKPAPQPQPIATVNVPKGTALSATLGQSLSTSKSKVGDTFAASLTAPVQLDGKTVIPKGAQVTGRVVSVKKHELKLTLASVVLHGKSYPVETNAVASSKIQPPKTATQKNAKATDKPDANKDITVIAAKSQATFKLAKPAAIPVKAAPAAAVKG